jgi:Type III restriction enzyme, res subunit/Helicase conserved C-terminal domain
MGTEGLHHLTPESISSFVNFNFNDPAWQYHRDASINIPKIQAEGSAKLWNLLLDKQIALLADEVGMGKTIQALAVMSVLWRQKPGAKVLLYAPNHNVSQKWMREYQNFIRYNYRQDDNLVKSSLQGQPLRGPVFCENHLELLQQVKKRWPSFFVCKTSSLSGFLSPKITQEALDLCDIRITKKIDEQSSDEDKARWMAHFGLKSNANAYHQLSTDGEPPFDLLIFDEAHYLRRTEWGNNISDASNRGIAAHAFFSGRDIVSAATNDAFRPLAKHVLLMTATPNHAAPDDIKHITSLFRPQYRNKQPVDILNEICIRRFRRLAGKTKHEYRQEFASGVEMKSLKERLFFAAYHKSLVRAKAEEAKKTTQTGKRDNPYSILFGYLEGFEFLPEEQQRINKVQQKQEGTDFHEREDTKVIVELSKLYKRVYRDRPEHPKYREMIDRLQPSDQSQPVSKKLVFVRRINSVYEISNRVIESYDDLFGKLLEGGFQRKYHKSLQNNPRKFCWELSKTEEQIADHSQGQAGNDGQSADEKLKDSRYLSLFTIKKEGKYRTTDCSNFRLRFLKKESLFSVFFEPPADYQTLDYHISGRLLSKQGKTQYKTSIQRMRVESLAVSDASRSSLTEAYQLEDQYEEKQVDKAYKAGTLLLIWLTFEPQAASMKTLVTEARTAYAAFSVLEKEGFSHYLEAGVLFASRHVVWFYSLYRSILSSGKAPKVEELYAQFCARVSTDLEASGLAHLISTAVVSFRTYYKKELGYSVQKIHDQDWSFLKNVVPVYPYCGNTKRETIIKAFNSPFYPDVLVATSVLQEGVDLHYHCSEVIHYGIAWTQGDNEQRVGRVDRMFGKMEKQLTTSTSATLPIHYPYLKKTIDQDQVARFLLRKHESEKLLDQLKHVTVRHEINWREQVSEAMLGEFLNTPQQFKVDSDPFPVVYDRDFKGIKTEEAQTSPILELQDYIDPILGSIRRHFGDDLIIFKYKEGQADGHYLFTLNHIRKDKDRHQPVSGELFISEEGLYFLNKPVFCLRISTPLARSYRNFEHINRFGIMKDQYRNHPLLKICHDKQQRGYFKFYVCSDLPVFITQSGQLNLSEDELLQTIRTLIQFSDDLEHQLHGHQQDVSYADIWGVPQPSFAREPMGAMRQDIGREHNKRWKPTSSGDHLYVQREQENVDYKEAYVINHETRFLKVYKDEQSFKRQTGIYKNDALEEEMRLLELILEANLNR